MIFRRKQDEDRAKRPVVNDHSVNPNYLKLEERRVLNATFAFDLVAHELTLENFVDSSGDDNSVDITQMGNDYVFNLNDGIWSTGGAIAGLDFTLSNGGSTLTVNDAATSLSSIVFNDNTAATFDLIFDQFNFSAGRLDINSEVGSFGTVTQSSLSSSVSIAQLRFSVDTLDFGANNNDFQSVNGVAENDITIHDQNDLSIQILSSQSGQISIETVGSILIDDLDSNLSLIGADRIEVVTTGIHSDIVVNNSIFSTGGDIWLSAADELQILSGTEIQTSGSGNITLLANQIGGDNNGTIHLSDGTLVNAELGNIYVSNLIGTGEGDVSVSQLTTNSTADSAIVIESAARIIDGSASESSNLSARFGGIQLIANGNIGASGFINDLDVDVDSLAFNINGALFLSDIGDGLTIDALGPLASSSIQDGGWITANHLVICTDVLLHDSTTFFTNRSALPNNDIIVNNNAVVVLDANSAGEVVFSAADDLIFDSGSVVTVGSDSHQVTLIADREMFADGDSGSVTNTAAGPAQTISTNFLTIHAGDGIGDSGGSDTNTDQPLRIDVDSIIAFNSDSNSILLREHNNIALVEVTNIGRDINILAAGDITDGDAMPDNVDVAGGTIVIVSENGSIGSGDTDIFKTIIDPIEVEATVSLDITATTGLIAVEQTGSFVDSIFSGLSLVFSSTGDLDAFALTAFATLNVENMALIADSDNDGSGTLTIFDDISVNGDLRIEGHEVIALDAFANESTARLEADRLFLSVDVTSQFDTAVDQLDVEFDFAVAHASQTDNQHLFIDNHFSIELVDLNCDTFSILSTNDDVKLVASGNVALLNDVETGEASLFLIADGNLTQSGNASISSSQLGLMIHGDTTLTANNVVDQLAAHNVGSVLFVNSLNLEVSMVSFAAGSALEMQLSGIQTQNADVKLILSQDLFIEQDIEIDDGNLFLSVGGNLVQSDSGTVTANGLGIMAAGLALLDADNDVNVIATENAGLTVFNNVDDLLVGSVSVLTGSSFEMSVQGITNSADVKLTVNGDLSLAAPIQVFENNLWLHANSIDQHHDANLQANGLALIANDNAILNAENQVHTVSANVHGLFVLNDLDGLVIGTVSVATGSAFEMVSTGILSEGEVKIAVADNLSIESSINVDDTLFLNVGGDLEQTLATAITTGSVGLMVEGETILKGMNDVDILAADVSGSLIYNDIDDLVVSSVTVASGTAYEMAIAGISTNNEDLKLNTDGSLLVSSNVATGQGTAFFGVGGNLTQDNDAAIVVSQLGLMVEGDTELTAENQVELLAAFNQGHIVFNSTIDLIISTVSVFNNTQHEMTVSGLSTSDSEVLLTNSGSLTIEESVNIGNSNLVIESTENVTQSLAGTINATSLGIFSAGDIVLKSENDVDSLAAQTNGKIIFNDVDDLQIGTTTVFTETEFQALVSGIVNPGMTKITTGGDLLIHQSIDSSAGTTFIVSSGSITQSNTGTILANGLGLMSDESIILGAQNDVDRLAIQATDEVVFNNSFDLTVTDVTVFSGTEHEMTLDGIFTENADAKLSTTASLEIHSEINVGSSDLFLSIGGNATQQDDGIIKAGGLGTSVSGQTILELANSVNVFAAENQALTIFNNVTNLQIGWVDVFAGTEFSMFVSGVSTGNDDVKITTGGDLYLDRGVTVGAGTFFATVAGNLHQSLMGTIDAGQFGTMVGGETVLGSVNSVDTVSFFNDGKTLFNDVDDLEVGSVSVAIGTLFEMNSDGIFTGGSDLKLTTGDDLQINSPLDVGSGTAILMAGGNLTQNMEDPDGLDGIIRAAHLGAMAGGSIDLSHPENQISVLAAEAGNMIQLANALDLTIGTVEVDSMIVDGLKTQSSLNLNLAGSLNQTSAIHVMGESQITATGNICLTGGDGVNNNDFGGSIHVTSGNSVEILDVNDLIAGNVVAREQVWLRAGVTEFGQLVIDGNIETINPGGNILLQASAGVVQSANSVVTTDRLMLGSGTESLARSGDFLLTGNNVVHEIAANIDGRLSFTNRQDLHIAPMQFSSSCGSFQQLFFGIDVMALELNVTADESPTGNLTDALDSISIIETTADFNVAGDIVLGDGDATLSFTRHSIENLLNANSSSEIVRISAIGNAANKDGSDLQGTDNVTLFVDSTIILGESNILDSLFIDTVESHVQGGDILQSMNDDDSPTTITATDAAFVSNASVQLTHTDFTRLAVEAVQGHSQVIMPFQLNPNIGSTFTGSLDANVFADTGLNPFLLNGLPGGAISGVFDVESELLDDGFFTGNNDFVNSLRVGAIVVNEGDLELVSFDELGLNPTQLSDVNFSANAITTLGDTYLETSVGHDLAVNANVDVLSVFSNITVVAGDEIWLENDAEFRRLSDSQVVGIVNTIQGSFLTDHFMLQDPRSVILVPGDAAFSDLNAQLDTAIGYQTFELFLGNPGEQSFNVIVGWFVDGVTPANALSASFQQTLLQEMDQLSNDFLLSNFGNFGQSISAFSIQLESIIDGLDPALVLSNTTQFEQSFFANQSFMLSQIIVTNDARINLFSDGGQTDLNFSQEVLPTRIVTQNPSVIVVEKPTIEIPATREAAPQKSSNFVNLIPEPESPPVLITQQPDSFFLIRYTADDDGIYEESFKWSDPNDDPDAIRAAIERAVLSKDGWPDTEDEEEGNWTERIKNEKQVKPGLYFIFEVQEGQRLPEPVDAPVDRTDLENLVEPSGNDSVEKPTIRFNANDKTQIGSIEEFNDNEADIPTQYHRDRPFSAVTQSSLLGSTLLIGQCLINRESKKNHESATIPTEELSRKNLFSTASRFLRRNGRFGEQQQN